MLLFLGLLFALASSSVAECPPDTIYETFFDKCYKYYNNPLPFLGAEKQCNSIGGNLVAVQSPVENGYVSGIASGATGRTPNFWIGANQLMAASWSWTFNTSMTYTNWAPGQPGASYPCGLIRDSDSKWISGACNSALPFVCTVDPNASQPGYCPTPTQQQPAPTCLSTNAYPCPDDAVCTDGYTLFSGNCMCYKKYHNSDTHNFNTSIAQCASYSATLLKIDTPELTTFLVSSLGTIDGAWIGLQCSSSMINSCQWLDGSVPIYTNFAGGSPGNNPYSYWIGDNGKWYFANPTSVAAYTMCQRPSTRGSSLPSTTYSSNEGRSLHEIAKTASN